MVNIPSQDVYEYNACNAAFSLPHVGYPNLFQAIDFQSVALSFYVKLATRPLMITYRFGVFRQEGNESKLYHVMK